MQKPELKKNWQTTPEAFRNLLKWLDGEVDSDGQEYLEMRNKLVLYFDRKNCLSPDDLADETLHRVARRLEEEGKIESETPGRYCYITARFVFMEYLRSTEKTSVSLDEMPKYLQEKYLKSNTQTNEKELKEKRLECLEHCTKKLKPDQQKMILEYYFGEEKIKIDNRRKMAKKLGITVNALSIRACRIREKLEFCVGNCVKED